MPDRAHGVGALARAVAYLWRYRLQTSGAFVSLILSSAALLAVPQLLRVAIDRGLGARDGSVLVAAVAGLLGAGLVRGTFAFLQGYLLERTSQHVAFDLREALFEHVGRLSFSFYDRAETGQLLTRLTNDVEEVRAFAGSGIVQLAASGALLLGATHLLLATSVRLTAVTFLVIVPMVALLAGFVRAIAPRFREVQQALGRLTAMLQQGLVGVRTIRAFGREDHEAARFSVASHELQRSNLVMVIRVAGNFPLVLLLANFGTLAVIWIGGRAVMDGSLSTGELIAFNSYLALLVQPLLTIALAATNISRAVVSSERVFELLDAPCDVREREGALALPPVDGRIDFEGVRFRYPGAEDDVLRGVSFTVRAGETVALVGATGSGKSTIANLLPRFYDVTAGTVRVDGHDVRDVTLDSLRSQIAVVLQDARLAAGTVRENIAFGRLGAPLEAIRQAAAVAQADAFIRALPQGYDTVVGERGVTLSGGQRQRIAIARALLVERRILILDDSTSALDTTSEAALRTALDDLLRYRRHSALLITQRISTARGADHILVLEDGRIAARGTHATLLEESPWYRAFVESEAEPRGDFGRGVAASMEPSADPVHP